MLAEYVERLSTCIIMYGECLYKWQTTISKDGIAYTNEGGSVLRACRGITAYTPRGKDWRDLGN